MRTLSDQIALFVCPSLSIITIEGEGDKTPALLMPGKWVPVIARGAVLVGEGDSSQRRNGMHRMGVC